MQVYYSPIADRNQIDSKESGFDSFAPSGLSPTNTLICDNFTHLNILYEVNVPCLYQLKISKDEAKAVWWQWVRMAGETQKPNFEATIKFERPYFKRLAKFFVQFRLIARRFPQLAYHHRLEIEESNIVHVHTSIRTEATKEDAAQILRFIAAAAAAQSLTEIKEIDHFEAIDSVEKWERYIHKCKPDCKFKRGLRIRTTYHGNGFFTEAKKVRQERKLKIIFGKNYRDEAQRREWHLTRQLNKPHFQPSEGEIEGTVDNGPAQSPQAPTTPIEGRQIGQKNLAYYTRLNPIKKRISRVSKLGKITKKIWNFWDST